MWEQRGDHKPKLKPNAIPTIFGFFIKEKMRITEKEASTEVPTESIKTSNIVRKNELEFNQPINVLNEENQVSFEIFEIIELY